MANALHPRYIAALTTARTHAFIPGASPPEVIIAIFLLRLKSPKRSWSPLIEVAFEGTLVCIAVLSTTGLVFCTGGTTVSGSLQAVNPIIYPNGSTM